MPAVERPVILDLGIGESTTFYDGSTHNSLVIGVDIEPLYLRLLRSKHPRINPVVADASGKMNLPFPSACVNEIRIIFPNDSLIWGYTLT